MAGANISICENCEVRCCYSYTVPVTGYDAWVIASALHLSLEQFLVFIPEQQRTADGFQLDQTGSTYTLALNKQRSRGKNQPCIFLLTLPEGYNRCGIYPHRPLVCQTFPAVLHHGSADIRQDTVFPKGAWNAATIELPMWRLALLRMEMESTVYRLAVSQWNDYVKDGPSHASYSILQYFAYLMNAYSRLEKLRGSIPEAEMGVVQRTWGQRPLTSSSSQEIGSEVDEGQMPWERFLTAVAEALEEFAAMSPQGAACA